MIILRNRKFSSNNILNTNGAVGFIKGRKYDTDMDRLGRMETSQRELMRTDDMRKEIREMNSVLNRGLNLKE
jgi:hypothetical protein